MEKAFNDKILCLYAIFKMLSPGQCDTVVEHLLKNQEVMVPFPVGAHVQVAGSNFSREHAGDS